MRKFDIDRASREMKNLERKIKEIDDRFYILYEDKLNGTLSEERFKEMSRRCETEQNELKERLSLLTEQVSTKEEVSKGVDIFIATVKEFCGITELDKVILHRLIDRITVGNKYYANGKKKQEIKVYYKFVGEGV